MSVSPFDHLLICADQVIGGHTLRILSKATHIIRAFEQHQPLHAGRTQHVAVKARHSAESRVGRIPKNSVSSNTHIDNRKVSRCGIGVKPVRQHAGPASVRVWSGRASGRAGCSKHDNRAGVGWRHHLDTRNPKPRGCRGGARHLSGGGHVAGHDIVRPQSRSLARRRSSPLGRINADGEITEGRNIEADRIADHHCAGRYRHRGFSREEKGAVGTRNDCRSLTVQRDMDGAQHERSRPIHVR